MFTSEGAWQDFVTLLERLALSPEEGAILTSIGYGILRLDLLPQITATESQKAGPFGSLSEAEAQTGLSSCFSKGWLRIVDEKALDEMRSLLREQGVTAYERGLPLPGEVTFTPEGARIYQQLD